MWVDCWIKFEIYSQLISMGNRGMDQLPFDSFYCCSTVISSSLFFFFFFLDPFNSMLTQPFDQQHINKNNQTKSSADLILFHTCQNTGIYFLLLFSFLLNSLSGLVCISLIKKNIFLINFIYFIHLWIKIAFISFSSIFCAYNAYSLFISV